MSTRPACGSSATRAKAPMKSAVFEATFDRSDGARTGQPVVAIAHQVAVTMPTLPPAGSAWSGSHPRATATGPRPNGLQDCRVFAHTVPR